MAWDTHVRRGHPIVFGLLTIFGIIELAISAWLTSRFNLHHNYLTTDIRDRTQFLLFCSVWTVFFSLLYSVLWFHSATGSILTSVASHGIFFFLTWVFWTAGAASITASFGGGLNCAHSGIPYCGQQNAEEGFAWVEWILVTFGFFFVILRGISSARRGDGMRGGLISA